MGEEAPSGFSGWGCVGETVAEFVAEVCVALVVCAVAGAIVLGFAARPGLTSGAILAALSGGWFLAWRSSRNALAAVLIVLAVVAAAVVLYLPYCGCG